MNPLQAAVRRSLFPLLLLAWAVSASGQGVVNLWPTLAATQNFGFDQVDNASLANSFHIPIMARQGRGISLSLSLNYNSQIWSTDNTWGFPYGSWQPTMNGYGWTAPMFGEIGEGTGYVGSCGYPLYDPYGNYIGDDGSVSLYVYQFFFVDAGGVVHPFSGAWYSGSNDPTTDCPAPSAAYTQTASDNSGYQVSVSATGVPSVTSPDGTLIDAWGDLTDRNGNQITAQTRYCSGPGNPLPACTASSQTITEYYDTLDGSNPALTVASSSASPEQPTTFTYAGAGGNPVTVTEQFETRSVATSFGCSGTPEWSTSSASLPSELDLPDGTKYTFTYAANGQLASVTLPTGATINYARGYSCPSGAAYLSESLARTDTVTGGAGWTWSGNASVSHVTDPDGAGTALVFGAGGLASSIAGAASTVYLCYNGASLSGSACSSTPNAGVFINEDRRYTTLADTNQTDLADVSLNWLGNPTEEDDYDWGPGGAPGGLLRKTLTTYYGDFDFPASVKVQDGAGNTVSQTTNTYDQGTPTGSGATQLTAPPGLRGNLTTQTVWVNPSSSLTKTFTYYDTGQVDAATDFNGGTTTYSYGACNHAFPTSVQEAVAGLSVSMAWNCSGGVRTSYTDENGHAAYVAYADPHGLWRPSSTTDAAANTTNFTYTPAAGPSPATVESAMNFNSGQSVSDQLTTLDGLGRPYLSQTRQGPALSTFDSVQTVYDQEGRPHEVSAPYVGTASATAPGGTAFNVTTFDSAGRTHTITDGGGGVTTYGYNGNDVSVTRGPAPSGENTKQRQFEFDGLGRLKSVCEVTAAAGSGPCGQSHGANGYLTLYARNPLGAIIQVTQNAQGAPTQSRSFSFDGLGRLTAETNPESGTTQYFFDSDSTCSVSSGGDLVRRVDASGNTTCYSHDSLHRVTQISYPSGPSAGATPTKTFVYDSDTGIAVSGAPGYIASSLAGRLVGAYTGPGNAPDTEVGFAYDALGRTVYTAQESPTSAGWQVSTEAYSPAGAPQALGLPGAPAITYGLDGEGRPQSVSVSSGQNPVSAVSYNVAGQASSVTLGSGEVDSFTFDPNTGRPTSSSFGLVAGAYDYVNLTWNANGTLAQTAQTDYLANAPDNQTCNYTHDDLGRLASVACAGGVAWQQTFAYDPFGNVVKSGSQSFGAAYSNNRISTDINFSPNYDSDGDLLDDPVSAQRNVNAFDSEGHAVMLEGIGVTYDALGRAVEAAEPSGAIEFLYGPDGGKLAVMQGQTLKRADIPLPGGGEAVYQGSGLAYYRHADWLGSSRLASTPGAQEYSIAAYAPYGEPYDDSQGPDHVFAGQKQDIVGGQYDFLLREYNPIQGRWWTPDPAGLAAVDPNNPQSWNRYAYVGGTPLEATDPLGLCHAEQQGGQIVVDDNPGDCAQNSTITVFADVPPNDGGGFGDLLYEGLLQELGLYWVGPQPAQAPETPSLPAPAQPASAPNNGYKSNYPSYKGLFCTGDALAAKGLSVGLDVVGAVPGLGNAVSASAAGARAVDGIVTWGGGVFGAAASLSDETPYGAASAGGGLGLAFADVTLGGTKAIPIVGNVVSGLTGLYDIYGAYKAYHSCMSSSKYD